MPKRMPSPSYQERVQTLIDSRLGYTWTTRELASQSGLTPSQVGGALSHLVKKGLVGQARSGIGEYTSKTIAPPVKDHSKWATIRSGDRVVPKPATNGRYEPGTLFEVAGYTEAGTLVLRSLDTQLLVPVKLHTAVSNG